MKDRSVTPGCRCTARPQRVPSPRQPRWVSENGQVFFDSLNGIVPEDTNATQNVYEYEDGHVYLISSPTSPYPSYFDDASPSGNDVFFTTYARLVGQDADELPDLYDARVDGGIADRTRPPLRRAQGKRVAVPQAKHPRSEHP